MTRMRLKEGHASAVKLRLLMDFADELGIELDFHGNRCQLIDKEFKHPIDFEDIEPGNHVDCFPYTMEYKLTYEKQG